MSAHSTRAHSKFSASGSERWLNCAASVELEEGLESKDSVWSLEGTEAHEVLETLFKIYQLKAFRNLKTAVFSSEEPMIKHAKKMILKVLEVKKTLVDPILLVEVRVYNNEIDPEMFGTVDAALVELFGTLHVFDYKYGEGHVVNPEKNTQMIQYALGLAEKYDWQFTDVVVHICQPRGSGSGHKEWKLTIEQLKDYRDLWKKGVARVHRGGNKPFEGSWCFWCKARNPDDKTKQCPKKRDKQKDEVTNKFLNHPLTEGQDNGFQEEIEVKSTKEKSRGKKESKEKSRKKVKWD